MRTDARTEIKFPDFTDGKIGDFEIRASGTRTRRGLFGRRYVSGWYEITCFSLGKRTIPQADLRYRRRGSAEWTAKKVRAIDIAVDSILAAAGPVSDIKDIRGPMGFFDIVRLMIILALIVSTAAIGAYVVYRVTRKPPERKSPYQIAMEELETIKGSSSGGVDMKRYYVDISDCVRRYIEEAFSLKAPEMTTEEFLLSLKSSVSLSAHHKDLLKDFLGACDLVKFAKYAPTRIEAESIFTTAKRFIEETRDVHL